MSSFTTPLIVQPLDDGMHWVLVESFEYRIGAKDSGEIINIPKGFITNFASVPRGLWNIFPPWDKYGKAAVLHDYLYHVKRFTRKRCDDIFLEAMEVLGVSKWKRLVIYYAVKLAGWKAWNES